MFEKLWNAQPTAAKRRVHLTFRDATTGDNKDPGSLTGKKASVRLDGSGSLVTTTNDVVALNQTDHLGAGYVEFTLAELTAFGSGELLISVSGITGVKVEDAQATLYTFDPNDPGASTAQIAAQVRTELQTELADVVELATNAGTLTSSERNAIVAALFGTVIETNGGVQIQFLTAIQLAAAIPAGLISGILAGAGAQTINLTSASGQPFLAIATDELGNRASVTITPIT